jgi:tRNA(fMet)-specific endonuclease VapC
VDRLRNSPHRQVSTRATRAVVVDTMAVSPLVNASRNADRAAAYRRAIADDPILVSFVTITELRYGALRAGSAAEFASDERDLAQLVVVQPDDLLMRTCAELRDSCDRAGHGLGHKIHEADRWIAATAIRLGVDLISDDTVFGNVPDLAIRTIAAPRARCPLSALPPERAAPERAVPRTTADGVPHIRPHGESRGAHAADVVRVAIHSTARFSARWKGIVRLQAARGARMRIEFQEPIPWPFRSGQWDEAAVAFGLEQRTREVRSSVDATQRSGPPRVA